MAKDISSLFEIGDLIDVTLKKTLYAVCLGSETSLFKRPGEGSPVPVIHILGTYAGDRPGLIKVKPMDKSQLAAPADISRYLTIQEEQIKEVKKYGPPQKIFP